MSAASDKLDEIKRYVAELEALVDPAVCRLQFPDGSVPGNAKEAAEGWKRRHDEVRGTMLYYQDRCLKMAGALHAFVHGKRPDGTSIDPQAAIYEAKKILGEQA
jgi:hypothetical protein